MRRQTTISRHNATRNRANVRARVAAIEATLPPEAFPRDSRTISHHGRAVARATVAGEAVYHGAEIAGQHHFVIFAASLLLVCLFLRIALHLDIH